MKNQESNGKSSTSELLVRRKSEIPDLERLQTLQEKLYQKAKQEPEYRFYVLYDKLQIPYVLREAWKSVKRKNSAAGIDGKYAKDVEEYGVEKFLEEIREELRTQSYKPEPIKRIYVEKPNGKLRPIGIGSIKDRVVQTAVKQIIECIFEADFEDSSYGFRPNRSGQDAIKEIKINVKAGYTEVYDADLSAYFDTIPHNKLYIVLKQRIADPRLLKLIDKFLKAPIVEDGEHKGGKKNKIGTPQGGILSPLLANIYMNLVDKAVNRRGGIFHKHNVRIVRYADDFVLMSKGKAGPAYERLRELLNKMELQLNMDKTKCVDSMQSPFDFLGFTIRLDVSLYQHTSRYWNVIPSKKSVKRVRLKIRELLDGALHYPPEKLVGELNPIIRGWINYYDIEGVSYPRKAKRNIERYLDESLFRYFNRKSQRKSRLYRQKAFAILVNKFGLIAPTKYPFTRKVLA